MDLSEIIGELAKKHNLTKGAVEQIINSEFSFIRKVMTDGEFKCVMIAGLGKFMVRPNRRLLLTESIRQMDERKQDSKKTYKHRKWLEKYGMGESTSGGDSKPESTDMQPLQS